MVEERVCLKVTQEKGRV